MSKRMHPQFKQQTVAEIFEEEKIHLNGNISLMGATSGIMSAGMGALTGGLVGSTAGMTLLGSVAAATMASAAIGGAVGSMVAQGLGVAAGVQDKFSWSQVAISGIGAAISSGIGAGVKAGVATEIFGTAKDAGWVGSMSRATVGNMVTQGISVASGLQDKFSWTTVAASGVGAVVGYGVGKIGGSYIKDFADSFGGKLTSGLANAGVQSGMISGGFSKLNWGEIAASSFGSSLGDQLVGGIIQGDLKATEQEVLDTQAMAQEMMALNNAPLRISDLDNHSAVVTYSDFGYVLDGLVGDNDLYNYSLDKDYLVADASGKTAGKIMPKVRYGIGAGQSVPVQSEDTATAAQKAARKDYSDMIRAGRNPYDPDVVAARNRADATLSNYDQSLGRLEGLISENLDGIKSVGSGIKNAPEKIRYLAELNQQFDKVVFGSLVGGDSTKEYAKLQQKLAETGLDKVTPETISKALEQMGKAERAQLADAYLRGDARAVGVIQGKQLANIPGGFGSSVKVVKTADKIMGYAVRIGKNITYPPKISFSIKQKNHLAMLDGFTQKAGISGAHNANEFYTAVNKHGVKIISEVPSAKGITTIDYKIPSYDRAGNITGYKDAIYTKTIYDPKVFSDQKILDLGQQAAASGYEKAMSTGSKAYNSSAGGVNFRVYVDPKTGIVHNFHPRK